jgi:predicted phage terminase large subunit-like protein
MNFRDIDIEKTWVLSNTLNYTRYFFKKKTGQKFIVGDHHVKICEMLDRVVKGEIKKLIINIAPRYGKTEVVVKSFISNGFAINPKSKFIHLSYSEDLVLDNSKEINVLMNSPDYRRLFEAVPTSINAKKFYTEQGGGMYAVSSSGQVTGFGAGVVDPEEEEKEKADLDEFTPCFESSFAGAIIIDDPIKPDDALSDTIREKVNLKFETTIRNRVNSRNTPIIIIMQRLHEHDLCGYLMETEPGEWTVLSLPCIYIDDDEQERALWPHKHTLEELRKIETANSYVFQTQYMQDPKPIEGLMYTTFRTYDIIPYSDRTKRKNYTDTADTGSDYLCSICYDELPEGNYITDVLYTKKPMEYTEPKTAEMLTRNKTEIANIESNNGGRGFARAVEKLLREMKNNKTTISWFTQTENKAVRIFNHSAEVQNLTFFPSDWERRWPEFASHLKSYRKEGGNAHDDAEDAITGTVEKRAVMVRSDINKSDLGIY